MSLWTSIQRLGEGATATGVIVKSPVAPIPPAPLSPDRAVFQYRVLRALYDENGVYDDLRIMLNEQGLDKEDLQGLRNPANRVVEFYADTMWPGSDLKTALPIDGPDWLKLDVDRVWKWSNWASMKQVSARWLAIYGDTFTKVVGIRAQTTLQQPKVYYQLLEPETATDVTSDERGYITHIRFDVAVMRPDAQGRLTIPKTVTEVWDKVTLSLRKWEHDKGAQTDIQDLGPPDLARSLIRDFGIDFIPIVQSRFRDVGGDRGQGAYAHCFEKITEGNRSATRLHALLFRHNEVTWAVNGGLDAGQRPLPAPEIDGVISQTASGDPTISVFGGERFVRLPGQSQLESLVPQIDYLAALAILQDHMKEVGHDLPELDYYRLQEFGSDLSGRAVQMLLSAAVAKCLEARGNAEAGLIRLNQMALQIGKEVGAFTNVVGMFDDGAWDHVFEPRPVIPMDETEEEALQTAKLTNAMMQKQLGIPLSVIQKGLGYSDAEIKEMAAAKAEEDQAQLEQQMQMFNAGNGGTGGLNPPARNGNGGGQPVGAGNRGGNA